MAKKQIPHSARRAGQEAEKNGEEKPGSRVDKRVVAGVAGIAVGSAAIAAALLFAGRNSKPKSAAIAPPPPRTPPAPATTEPSALVETAAPLPPPDASTIEIAKAD